MKVSVVEKIVHDFMRIFSYARHVPLLSRILFLTLRYFPYEHFLASSPMNKGAFLSQKWKTYKYTQYLR